MLKKHATKAIVQKDVQFLKKSPQNLQIPNKKHTYTHWQTKQHFDDMENSKRYVKYPISKGTNYFNMHNLYTNSQKTQTEKPRNCSKTETNLNPTLVVA